jgi:hypothetical protein
MQGAAGRRPGELLPASGAKKKPAAYRRGQIQIERKLNGGASLAYFHDLVMTSENIYVDCLIDLAHTQQIESFGKRLAFSSCPILKNSLP